MEDEFVYKIALLTEEIIYGCKTFSELEFEAYKLEVMEQIKENNLHNAERFMGALLDTVYASIF